MSALIVALISFVMIILFVSTGIWLFAGLGTVGLICSQVFQKTIIFTSYIPYSATNSFTLTAVPMFLMMGEILLRAGVTDRLFRAARVLLGFLPGTLYHAVVFSCSIFAAISGSSLAAATTIGRVSIPELDKLGYEKRLTRGAVCSGGTLANLIPPSIGMIIYGTMTNESIGRVFFAGVVPGMMVSFLFVCYIMVRVRLKPSLIPSAEKITKVQGIKDILGILPILGIMFVVLGTIYLGAVTPTEAGAIGAIMATVLAAAYRRLSWTIIKESAFNCVKVTSMLLLIVVGGSIVSNLYGSLRLTAELLDWTNSLAVSPLWILMIVCLFYIIMGCFIDGISMMIMSLAVTHPLIISLGYNGVWFGVVLMIIIEVGLITPPVGMTLYAVQAVTPGTNLKDIFLGSVGFLVMLIVSLIIIIIWPEIALWFPNRMYGGVGS